MKHGKMKHGKQKCVDFVGLSVLLCFRKYVGLKHRRKIRQGRQEVYHGETHNYGRQDMMLTHFAKSRTHEHRCLRNLQMEPILNDFKIDENICTHLLKCMKQYMVAKNGTLSPRDPPNPRPDLPTYPTSAQISHLVSNSALLLPPHILSAENGNKPHLITPTNSIKPRPARVGSNEQSRAEPCSRHSFASLEKRIST